MVFLLDEDQVFDEREPGGWEVQRMQRALRTRLRSCPREESVANGVVENTGRRCGAAYPGTIAGSCWAAG